MALGLIAHVQTDAREPQVPASYRAVAHAHRVDPEMLYRLALRRSGRSVGALTVPWPWTLGNGRARRFFDNRRAMIDALAADVRHGDDWVLVGPLQLSWRHCRLFGTKVEAAETTESGSCDVVEATDPMRNLRAGARLLQRCDTRRCYHGAYKGRYAALINRAAARYQLDPHLIAAVIQAESSFDPNALSPKGALGLMQLMPATATRFGLLPHQRTSPARNVDTGSRYLRWLLDYFGGNVRLALAGYNAGEDAVARYRNTVPPFSETRAFVRRVLRFYERNKAMPA